MSGAETQVDVPPVEWQGKSYKALADGKYDVIICGTGLKECIMSGLLSKKGMKVGDSTVHQLLSWIMSDS